MKLRLPLSLVAVIMSVFSAYSQTLFAEDVYYNLNLPAGSSTADWKAASWLNDSGVTAPWVDATPEAGTSARFNITGEDAAALTIVDPVTLYALSLNSGNLNITGGILNFINTGEISVAENSTLNLASTLTSDTKLLTKKGKGTLILSGEALKYVGINSSTDPITANLTIEEGLVNATGTLYFGKGTATLKVAESGKLEVNGGVSMLRNTPIFQSSGTITVTEKINFNSGVDNNFQKEHFILEAGSLTTVTSCLFGWNSLVRIKSIMNVKEDFNITSKGRVYLDDGAVVITKTLETAAESNSGNKSGGNAIRSSLNMDKGSYLYIKGDVNNDSDYKKCSLVFGMYKTSIATEVNIFGGRMDAPAAKAYIGTNVDKDSQNVNFTITNNSLVNLNGICNGRVGNIITITDSTLNIGAVGITSQNTGVDGKITFDGATLGALDSWENAGHALEIGSKGLTINTQKFDPETETEKRIGQYKEEGKEIKLGGTLTSVNTLTEGTQVGNLTKTGLGTLVLSGDNSAFTGDIKIENGTITVGGLTSLGSSSFDLTGGTLDMANIALTNDVEVFANSVILKASAFAGNLTLTSGNLSGEAINLASGTSYIFKSGSIANDLTGTGGVSKETAAEVTLSGANSYTGATTIKAGTLIISGSLTQSTVTVQDTATLQLSGSGSVVGNITMEVGSSLNMGNGMVLGQTQVLSAADGAKFKGNLSLDGGGTLKVAGDLVIDGVLSLDGGTFEWTEAKGMNVKGLVLGENSDADVLKLGNSNSYLIGAEGIKGRELAIGEATLGATADWTMEMALTLSNTTGGLTFNTGNAEAAYEIKLKGVVRGASKMTKTGKGTLILSGANANYNGGVSVKEGELSLGDDLALGTGALNMSNGTTLSAEGKSVTVSNAVSFGTISDTNYTVNLGKADQTDTLTLSGNAQFNGSKTTIAAASDVKFSGAVTSVGNTLTKTGAGALTFDGTLSSLEKIDVNVGTLRFGAEGALSSVQNMNMSQGTRLDLGGLSGIRGQKVNVASTLGLDGSNAYVGSVMMTTQMSRLTVTGDFSAGQIGFQLGRQNQVTDQLTPVLVTTGGSATITGTDKNSIILNFDVEYLSTFKDVGGSFQLFSRGLTYNQGTILNEQRQDVMLDESQLSSTGRISWKKQKKDVSWLTQSEADKLTVYKAAGPQVYLSSSGGEVTVGSNVQYDLDGYEAYKFSPGLGTLVYKGALTEKEAWLYVADYANVMDDAAQHRDGALILSNNGNKYESGTNILGTTLIVDMSRDENQSLDSAISNRNLAVSVLGSGRIEVVAGLAGGSTLQLQSYGNKTLTGVDTYTYGNEIHISGGSVLKQSGANAQILTGNITIGEKNNQIVNEGNKSLTLKGNITQVLDGSLTLKSESEAGRIILSGASQLKTDILNVEGAGVSSLSDGYTATLKGLVLSGGRLSVEKGSQLTMSSGNITGTGVLMMNGGTVWTTSSWQSDSLISFGGISVSTINTGGANVRFNKGVSGSGSFEKTGTGSLYIYDNKDQNAAVAINVKQGRLILKGEQPKSKAAMVNPGEYKLTGDLTLSGDKGASLEGMIDANNYKVNFGNNTKFYMSVSEEAGITGYIRNADTITFNTGSKLYLDVLDDTWVTNTDYTIFSANNGIIGADNLGVVMENEFAFVDVLIDKSKANEINLILSRKGGGGAGAGGSSLNDGTNKGAIHAVVSPLVADVLEEKSQLTSSMLRTVQTVSKMTTTEYDTYLGDMASSAVSYYTALSAQVYDATQHLNSVRNRVELINPVLYDDWSEGGVYNVWAGAINHYRDVKSDFQSPGYEMTSWGGELGCAIPMSESFMMGVGFAYTSTEVTVKDNWGTNESDTYNVDVFARYRKEQWTLTGVLTGGFSNVDFHRNQRIKDQITRSNSSSDGNQFMGTFEAMYDVYLNENKSWILQPLVNLTAGRAKLDGLSETGDLKNAGLDLDSQTYNMFSVGVGAKIAYEYQTKVSDQAGRVELKAMYVNDAGDVDFKVNGRFMGAPGSDFELDGVSNERSAMVVSAGWIAPISTYGQFFADASCEFRKDQNGVSSTVGFSFQF